MSGKRQRPAHFDIDEKTLEYKQNPQTNKEPVRDNEQSIKQRKIYKIKLPGDVQEVSDSKPKFTLFGGFNVGDKKVENLGKDQQKDKQQSQDEATKKPTEAASQKKQQEKKPEEKKPFSFSFSTPSFSFPNNGIGIFTNPNNSEGIFGKTNIFASNNSQATSIFKNSDSSAKPSGTVFGTSQSIFNFAGGVPPLKKQGSAKNEDQDGEDDDGDDGGELERDQKESADPTKSTGKYQYNSQCEVLFQHKILKFKKNDGDLLQNTQIIVQHDKQKNSSWVNIRLCATKNPILTGFLLKGKSSIKKMGNKDQNVVLSVLSIKDKQSEQSILKLQFQSAKVGEEFRHVVEKLLG